MRTILVASCLLLTALAVVPNASAADECRSGLGLYTVCNTLTPGGTDDCLTFGVGNPQTANGVCVRDGHYYVCVLVGPQYECFFYM